MALINCPECEKVISDKVKTCPNCGFPLSTDDDNVERSPQQVEVTSVNLSPKDPAKKKKFALYAVIAVVAIVAITLIWYMVKSSNEEMCIRDSLYPIHSFCSRRGGSGSADCLSYRVYRHPLRHEGGAPGGSH